MSSKSPMSPFDTTAEAYGIHKTIPSHFRASSDPLVRSYQRSVWRFQLPGNASERLESCRSELLDKNGFEAPTSIGNIVAAVLRNDVAAATVDGSHVWDHDTLQEYLRAGTIPVGLSSSSACVPLAVTLGRAKALGYRVSASPVPGGDVRMDAEERAFAAAHHLALRRFSLTVVSITPRFIVPDPLQSLQPHFFAQLWISRDRERGGIRLLALDIDPTEFSDELSRKRAFIWGTMGYEVFHVLPWWPRVDPQRVIHAFLRSAGVLSWSRFERSEPGPTINDYRCAFCLGPMIRTPSGTGIVDHDGWFVHEPCFNAAIDSGFFDCL
jgi:hypothetical protein